MSRFIRLPPSGPRPEESIRLLGCSCFRSSRRAIGRLSALAALTEILPKLLMMGAHLPCRMRRAASRPRVFGIAHEHFDRERVIDHIGAVVPVVRVRLQR